MDASANVRPAGDDDEDELFFEGGEAEPAPAPTPKPAAKRKARQPAPTAEEAATPPLSAPVAESDMAADTAEPSTEAAEPPVAAAPLPRLVLVALLLAVVASLFSAVGLLVAARTVTAAGIARDEAAGRAASLARLGHAVEEVEGLARAQRNALAQDGDHNAATASDVRREVESLRLSLGRAQAPGTAALAGVVRQGQAELSGRIDTLEARIDAISQRATREARR